MAVDQQAKKDVTTLARTIDSDHHEELRLLLNNAHREEYVWHTGGSPGHQLMIL